MLKRLDILEVRRCGLCGEHGGFFEQQLRQGACISTKVPIVDLSELRAGWGVEFLRNTSSRSENTILILIVAVVPQGFRSPFIATMRCHVGVQRYSSEHQLTVQDLQSVSGAQRA